MGMEVGVATETVVGQGGRKKRRRRRGGVTRPAEIRREATYSEEGPHCLCVRACVGCFFLCVCAIPVQ